MKNCFAIALTIAAAFAVTNNASAGPVSGTYDSGTGGISVSITSAVNWYVEHVGFSSMTGPDDVGSVLPLAPGLVTNNVTRVGESAFAPFSYDADLGAVAASGIADDGTLRIFWNDSLGGALLDAALAFGTGGVDPVADITSSPANGWDALIDPMLTLDASGSTGTGTLNYEWDLDDDGTFEINTGTTPTHVVADVIATFGVANVAYPVAVRVTDSVGSDIASTSIQYIPEPTSMALAGLGMIGFFSTRRRRNG